MTAACAGSGLCCRHRPQSIPAPVVRLFRRVIFLARLPQVPIEHQRRVPGRELSRNMALHPGFAQSRTRVIAVDVLPAPRFARTTRYERIAYRIIMMERDDRVRTLQARGVEILRWQEDATSLPRQARLQLMSRPARGAPSAGGRR